MRLGGTPVDGYRMLGAPLIASFFGDGVIGHAIGIYATNNAAVPQAEVQTLSMDQISISTINSGSIPTELWGTWSREK